MNILSDNHPNTKIKVIYAINGRLGGGGIGNTSYYAALGPERVDCLKRVICNSNAQTTIPSSRVRALGLIGRIAKRVAFMEKSGMLNDWVDVAFDHWASRVLESCTVLHCWNDLTRTLARGKKIGAVAVLESSMSHPISLAKILRKAAARWDVVPSDLPSPGRLKGYLEQLAIADFVTVPSEFNRQTYLENSIPVQKLRVVPYGVDLQSFYPLPKPCREHSFRAIFVGNFSLRKGALYLLSAWKHLGWEDAELWIVGNTAPEIQRFVTESRKLPGLKFWGHQKNVRELYHQADVFVLPSLGEGSALVSYEAMACGLPVIVTENTGSLARPDVDGYIIPSADDVALVDALERMRSQPERRSEMGHNARERIEPYTWESYGVRLMQTYQELLQQ